MVNSDQSLQYNSATSLIRTPFGTDKSVLIILLGYWDSLISKVSCPDFRGCNVYKQAVWDSQMCSCILRLSKYPEYV